jgi:hypothetical protein
VNDRAIGRSQATGKQEVRRSPSRIANPRCDGLPSLLRLLRDLELHGTSCLLLHDNRPCGYSVPASDVRYSELHKIAGAELAVDREIEQSKFSHALRELEAYPDRPNLLEAQGCLLPYELVLVPGFADHTEDSLDVASNVAFARFE